MSPKLSLKRIFDEAGIDRHMAIVLGPARAGASPVDWALGGPVAAPEGYKVQPLEPAAGGAGSACPPPPPRLRSSVNKHFNQLLTEKYTAKFLMACFDTASRTAKLPGSGNYLRIPLLRRTFC
ncbi:hypothetical protein FN846DRAFT_911262 [Sphaerosporella brunnea]|uniref:Uncharacterized protein n=1 Tax=Sphaerosporella brunnea TaxID=1250544 RepID=A0A5J5EMD6_9PEZI|nr:hypothetical protein FN846DRAFT_911262 [Sphaerosporella brunnea]